jgi:hypothetical protein
MRKGVIFLILLLIAASFFFGNWTKITNRSITGYSVSESGVMVEKSIVEKVENNEEVRVKVKGELDDIKEILEDKVIHEFEEEVSAVITEEELSKLQNNSNVDIIEPVGMRSISLQDSVPLINSSSELWNLQIDGINLTGTGETICIIDTGVNYNHADLGGCYGNNDSGSSCKILGGWDYCADDITCTTEDSDPMDAHWHGTHVSGIAAGDGSIKGVAPDAKLVVIKAANSTGTFWDDDLEKAIDWCVNNADTYNISVISMSLGGGLSSSYCNDDVLNDSINSAIANNISVVVASGNDGSTSQISGPACHENATPVGGTDKSDSMYSNGNRNSLVLLLAPGVSINSTYIDGGYQSKSGTSMSTPHVAGAFALINQYRRLEGLSEMTPSNIEDSLNDSGKVISDGGSGLDFSRIQIYQTIINMDESGPDITLESPLNNAVSSSENQTFTCSAEDIQLSNLTFYLWNSSDVLINETSYNATSNDFQIEVNETISNGTYTWNCRGFDDKGNSAWASSNYTLYIGNMLVTLNSPSHNTYTNSNSATFNCSVEDTVANLTNVTLKVWNSSSNALVYNTTENISGTINTSTFAYTLPSEESFKWNCKCFDEDCNSMSGGSNYTVTYDNTDPIVSSESPADEASETAGTITFEYSVTDTNNIDNCSLLVDGDIEDTDTSVSKGTTQELSVSLSAGLYDWKVRCYDVAGNIDDSSVREITISSSTSSDSDDTSSDSSSSAATTTTTGTTYSITDSEFEEGYSKELSEGDKIKFNKNNESHTLELEEATASAIRIKISSNPITVIIYLGDVKKVDLNADNIYDIEIKFNENGETTANITIKSIDEPIGTRQITDEGNESIGTSNETLISNPINYIKNLDKKILIIIGVIVGVIILAGVGYFLYKKNKNILGPVFKKKYEKLLKK